MENRKPLRSLFSTQEVKIGGFGSPILKMSQLGNGVTTLVGARGAMIINRFFTFGAAGYGLVAQTKLSVANRTEQVGFGYGGPGVGLKLFADKIIHVDIFNLFGFGNFSFHESNRRGSVFIIEPELSAELNLFRFMQLGVGASYRFAFASSALPVKSSDLFGFGGQAYLQFSWF
jgi:hypothetical protein